MFTCAAVLPKLLSKDRNTKLDGIICFNIKAVAQQGCCVGWIVHLDLLWKLKSSRTGGQCCGPCSVPWNKCEHTALDHAFVTLLPSQAALGVLRNCANTAVLKEQTEKAEKGAAVIFLLAHPYASVMTVAPSLASISGATGATPAQPAVASCSWLPG